MERIYHIGLINCNKLPYGHSLSNKVQVQMSLTKDGLSPDLWLYFGERINTKKQMRENRKALLSEINKSYGTTFEKIEVI